MTIGLSLLHKVITSGLPLTFMHDNNLSGDSFVDDELRAFEFIQRHAEEHHQWPQPETVAAEVKIEWPQYPNEPPGYFVDRVLSRNTGRTLSQCAHELRQRLQAGDIEDARTLLVQTYTALESMRPGEQTHTIAALGDQLIGDHDNRQRTVTMAGIPFGLPFLDEVSDGAQRGDSVAIVGRPGVGKTYALLRFAVGAYLYGKMPLVVTTEMTPIQVARRVYALLLGMSATKMRLGRLSYWGRKKVVDKIGIMQNEDQLPFYVVQGSLNTNIEDIALRVQELRPDALYVDGAYMLRSRKSAKARWEMITETSEMLKSIASEFHIPSIATYQFNRKGPGSLANIGGADAIGQLASIVIGIDNQKNKGESNILWSSKVEKILTLLKGREGEQGTIKVSYDMEHTKIEQTEVLSGVKAFSDEQDAPEDWWEEPHEEALTVDANEL